MDKAHVHYCWRASRGGGREELWSALCLLGRSAAMHSEQVRGGVSQPHDAHLPAWCTLRACYTKTEGETPPKSNCASSLFKGNELGWHGWVSWLCMGSSGWGVLSSGAGHRVVSGSPLPSQQDWFTPASTTHRLQDRVTYSVPFKSRQPPGGSSHFPPKLCSSSPEEEVGNGKGSKAFPLTLSCRKLHVVCTCICKWEAGGHAAGSQHLSSASSHLPMLSSLGNGAPQQGGRRAKALGLSYSRPLPPHGEVSALENP